MVEQNVFGQGLRCYAMLCYAKLTVSCLYFLPWGHESSKLCNNVSPGTLMILSPIYSSIPLIEVT